MEHPCSVLCTSTCASHHVEFHWSCVFVFVFACVGACVSMHLISLCVCTYPCRHVQEKTDAHKTTCGILGGGFVFDSYTNGDIVYTMGLVDTLKEIKKIWSRDIAARKRQGILVVGKRTNVEFYTTDSLDSDQQVQAKARKGTVFQNDAEDYFIYSRGARDWNMMPHFVVGRRAYDNWLVDNAFHDETIDLIDASNTILALHLTASDGNSAGHKKGADNNHNIKAFNPATANPVGPHEWDNGRTDHAHFFTKYKSGRIELLLRSRNAGSRQIPK
mmetsp:Transcript_35007/g.56529  ORF Transcript_35007/g.56529 Transcript_35007/m.56529 type:complete len:274 (+) Transcript_35007:654-1475(+)